VILRAILFIGLMGTGATALAEGANNARLSLSLYGGFAFAHNTASGLSSSISSRTGLTYGVGAEVALLPKLSLGLDILHITKSYDLMSPGVVSNFQLDYLNFPVLLRWRPTNYLMFETGPWIASFLLSATRESQGVYTPMKDSFKNDYGLSMGMWMGFHAKNNMSFGLNLRYDVGLADIQADNDPSSSINTRALLTLATIVFNFK